MNDLPPGWATDLAVLELSGSDVVDRGDHLVIRTPSNPGYHWGNCLLVTEESAVDDARRWTAAFREAHPSADWISIGLARLPDDLTAWEAEGVEVEADDVLTTRALPREAPLPEPYATRQLVGDDWSLMVAAAVRDNERSGREDPGRYEEYAVRQAQQRRALSERGLAAFFGAFSRDELVGSLGIVRCGERARYQDVGTDEAHRGRGLASHLLGVAAQWAHERGCDEWVIVTEASNPAGRVYRRAGFEPDRSSARGYRMPPR